MSFRVVLSDRGESEFVQTECGVETGRGKVVHEGPWGVDGVLNTYVIAPKVPLSY